MAYGLRAQVEVLESPVPVVRHLKALSSMIRSTVSDMDAIDRQTPTGSSNFIYDCSLPTVKRDSSVILPEEASRRRQEDRKVVDYLPVALAAIPPFYDGKIMLSLACPAPTWRSRTALSQGQHVDVCHQDGLDVPDGYEPNDVRDRLVMNGTVLADSQLVKCDPDQWFYENGQVSRTMRS